MHRHSGAVKVFYMTELELMKDSPLREAEPPNGNCRGCTPWLEGKHKIGHLPKRRKKEDRKKMPLEIYVEPTDKRNHLLHEIEISS